LLIHYTSCWGPMNRKLSAAIAVGLIAVPASAQTVVNVTINPSTTLTVNGTFKGFGYQTIDNWMWRDDPDSIAHPNFDIHLAPKIAAMKAPIARIWLDLRAMCPSEGVYDWTTDRSIGLLAVLTALKNAGTDVLVTIPTIPDWMTAYPHHDIDSANFPSPGTNPNYIDMWATAITDVMKHLYGQDGSGLSFSNIKWLGAPNEFAQVGGTNGLYPAYLALYNKLAAASVSVTLSSPDAPTTALFRVNETINDNTTNQLIGVYDFHEYNSFGDEATFISDFDIAAGLAISGGKQIFLTEYNTYSPPASNDWRMIPTIAMDAANHGMAAALLWDFAESDRSGAFGTVKHGTWEIKSSYYTLQMLTSHVRKDSYVSSTSHSSEQNPSLRVAAFQSPTGEQTVMAYNLNRNSSVPIRMSYLHGMSDRVLRRYSQSAESPAFPATSADGNSVKYTSSVLVVDGGFSDILSPSEFVVYSEVNPIAN
jgi:hypothetical protein